MSSSNNPKPEREITSTADLARYLNLSQWTVSRAINNHTDIGEKTRQRVLAAMDEVGFSPNPFARGLRGRGSRMVGISFSRLNVPILDQKIFRMQEFLREKSYRCLLETTMNDVDMELRVVKDFLRIHVEGMILVQSGSTAKQLDSLVKGLPIVLVDPVQPHSLPTVFLDRTLAQQSIFNHLFELGHRNFALLGITKKDTWRWPPLVDSAIGRGLDPEKIFHCYQGVSVEGSNIAAGGRMAEEMLKQFPRPTALICLDDLIAVGAVQALKHDGFSVPGDFSVVGFNNQDLASVIYPTLTTIDQHPDRTMKEAGDLLLQQINAAGAYSSGQITKSVRIEPTLVIGESTGPVSG